MDISLQRTSSHEAEVVCYLFIYVLSFIFNYELYELFSYIVFLMYHCIYELALSAQNSQNEIFKMS